MTMALATPRLQAVHQHLSSSRSISTEQQIFTTACGVRLAFRDTGGTGPPVMFLAGVGSRMDTFERHMADLSDDFRCIVLDNRGVGGSDAPTTPYTIDDMSRDALELLGDLLRDGEAAHVVGQSMGGMIAQRMAVMSPLRVRSLTLCSTVAWVDGRAAAYWGSLPTLSRSLSAAEFTRAMLPWMFGRLTLEDPSHPIMVGTLNGTSHPKPTPPHTYEIQVKTMLEFDSRAWLSEIRQPTLVTVGTDDIGTPPYQSEYLADNIEGARMHKFIGAGHRAINEQHEGFCSLLRAWVHEREPRSNRGSNHGIVADKQCMQVGFVGLGNMGGAIVRSMLRSGADTIVVFDQSRLAFERLLSELDPAQHSRLAWADSAKAAAEQCDVVCSMVPGPVEMQAVALGVDGIVAGLRPNAIYIDHTTTSPTLIEAVGDAVQKRGAAMCDAPVVRCIL